MFLKEIRSHFGNFLLAVIGMTATVMFIVLFFMMTSASKNETRVLTRDMGFNLKIFPKTTDMNKFWIEGYSDLFMPQDYVNKIVEARAFTYAHITATLHKKIQWHDKDVVLTGISPNELEPTLYKKSKMIFAVPPGKVYVGYELTKIFDIREGDNIEVLGHIFQVERTLSEVGSNDDIRMYFDLSQLQGVLHLQGKINEIMALNCVCHTPDDDDALVFIRDVLKKILPDTKVVMIRTIAIARERQRKMVDHYMSLLLPVFLIVCALWISTFAMQNVLQRKTEIGLFRSLGFNSWFVTRLFLFRALAIGLMEALAVQLNIQDRLSHKPAQLSVGEKQRVALLRALIVHPRLLLADEPTGNLDPENSKIIINQFDEYRKRGGTIVMASHGSEANELADVIVSMGKGKIKVV